MKKILITGSSRGIGRSIAKLAAQQGYEVVVHGRTDSKQLQDVHEEIKGSTKVFFDVSDKDETHEALSKVEDIDILINNAGVARNFLSDIQDLDNESAIEEYRTNVLGALHCIQATLPYMQRKKSGVVINISSIKGHPNLATLSTLTFAATKAGVISITKALAKSYPDIRFCSVSPGYIETDQVEDWNEETFKRINDGTILGRIGKPEEVASMVMMLASDEASYATGADYLVDGGYSIKGK